MSLIQSEIDNTCAQLGLPQNPKVSGALAKCIMTCMASPNRIDEAVEDLFNEIGLTEWRGKAMSEALLQVLRGLPSAENPANYLVNSFDGLTDLKQTLLGFEAQSNHNEDCDEDDEDYDEGCDNPLEGLLGMLGQLG